MEIMPRIEIIYEDTKAVIGAELELKWEQIYPMIKDQKVPDVGLEDIPLYENILRSQITKVSMQPILFLCTEVIDWILPKVDVNDMIMYNIEGKGFSSFTLAYLAKSCNIPIPKISMMGDWINILSLDYID